jgi:hypothetical protein
MVMRKKPVEYLVLPVARLAESISIMNTAKSCPLSEPDMEWLGK